MLFILRFTDKSGSESIRQQQLEAHIAWLDARRDSILVAGSLRENPEATPVGACWVVEAGSRAEVEKLYQSDPFWRSGMRAGAEILHWSKAFPDEKTLV